MNKEEIVSWLSKYKITKYTIDDNLVVDVDEYVWLRSKNLTSLPFQFGIVHGYFSCHHNQLTSLEHCPKVVKGNFDCDEHLKQDIRYLRHSLAKQLQAL